MDFQQVVRRRHMVRSYRPDPVDPGAIDRIVDTARRAPSAGFSQPHRFVVVTREEVRTRIADACGEPAARARGLDPWLSVAPVHIIPCVDRQAYVRRYDQPDKAGSGGPAAWEVPFDWVDGGAALMLVLLAAVDEGLAAGFLAVVNERLRQAVEIPPEWTPLGLVTVGHPADQGPQVPATVGSAVRPRLAIDDIVVRH